MYSPDDQGEYAPEVGASHFMVQGLVDALTEVPDVQLLPSVEFVLQFEVTIADFPGHPCPPAFSWNADMLMHVLKSDPTLRYSQGHTGHADTCQGGICRVDFLLLSFCCESPSPSGGVVLCSSGIRTVQALIMGRVPGPSNPYPGIE